MTRVWDWQFAVEILPEILRGLGVTLWAVLWGMAMALALGLVWALLRRQSSAWLRWPAVSVVEFIRSTPLLVQIFFVFSVFPAFGLRLTPLVAGILALGLHYSCYVSEVYRAGLNAVGRGQWEAATALNLSRWQTYRHVVLPQAIPPIVPALGNYLIAMFKDTPMLAAITVLEMLERATNVGKETFRFLEPLTIVGVIFLLLSLASALAVRRLERVMQVRHA